MKKRKREINFFEWENYVWNERENCKSIVRGGKKKKPIAHPWCDGHSTIISAYGEGG